MPARKRLFALFLLLSLLVAGCGPGTPDATPPAATPTPAPPTSPPASPAATAAPPATTAPPSSPTPIPATATPLPPTATPPPAPIPTAPAALDTIWRETYGGDRNTVIGDLLLVEDGGLYVVGTTNLEFEPDMQGDAYLLRVDAAGRPLWEKSYGDGAYTGGQSITRLDDGSLLVAGSASGPNTAGIDAYLLRVDADGNELWSRTYGGPLDEMIGAVVQTPDGNLILGGNIVDPDDVVADPGAAGYGGFAGRANLYLLKVDPEGNEIWSRAYDSEDNVLAGGGTQTPDGGFLALVTITRFPDPDDDIQLLKLDGEGNVVWTRTWEEGSTSARDLIPTSDGHYLLSAAYVADTGTPEAKEDFLLIKIDPDGNELWRSVFGDPDLIDYGWKLAEAPEGGFFTISERTPDRYTWEADLALVKVDEAGRPVWQEVWPAAHTMLSSLVAHPDGGYVIGGALYTDPVFNILLIRTTSGTEAPIATPAPAPTPEATGPFLKHIVDKDPHFVSGVAAHDIDGDGDLDIAAASMTEHVLAWWRNDGGTPIAWTKQVLAADYYGAAFVHPADGDGDGDVDLLSTAARLNTLDWWRNDGGEPITWTRQTLGEGLDEAQGLFAADLDGDGDTDVLATAARLNTVAWWENASPAGDGSRWLQHTIGEDFPNTQAVHAADLDLDGDLDVVAVAGDGNQVAWFQNDGGSPPAWTKYNIESHFGWAHWVHACDVDGDGRTDVLGAAYHDDEIAWWRNAGGDPPAWERQTIGKGFEGALNVHPADLDGDGDPDVLGTATNSGELAWWRNDGGSPIVWTPNLVGDKLFGAWPVHAGDLDGDGDLDVVSGSSSGTVWWENTLDQGTAAAAAVPSQPGVDETLAALRGLPLERFLEESFRRLQLRDPDTLIGSGLDVAYGLEPDNHFSDLSDAYLRETQRLEAGLLELLQGYDREALSPELQLSYDIYEWYLDDLVRGHEWFYHSYPVNGLGNWDTVNSVMEFMVNFAVADRQDAESYVERLAQLGTWTAQLLKGLQLREQAGIVPPRSVVERAAGQVESYLQARPDGTFAMEENVLYTTFRAKLGALDDLGAEEEQALLDAAGAKIQEIVVPALDELRNYLVHLPTVADDRPGVWKLPQGDAYYAYILRHHTGTDLSPDELHEMGLAAVAQVQAEMRDAAAEMGYPQGLSMAELDEILAAPGELPEGETLLAEFEQRIAEADAAAAAYFDLYPGYAPAVEVDPAAPPAYYRSPSPDGSEPGRMIASLVHPLRYTQYNVPVLVHHETIPGHHVQLALAVELGLPNYRRDNIFDVYRQHLPFQAYVEGWAFYAEQLAWEMGLYEEDPLGNLGRLRLELHRTARLVVDTGIHAKRWSVDEAIAYLEEATGTTYNPARLAQIITIPGQACGYDVGLLAILDLRQQAMDQLGDAFDIKAFHNVVLGNGAMPISVLERLVGEWIDSASSGG